MNLDALWNYMQIENEAVKLENAMRQSPKRQLLLKNRNLFKDLQNSNAKIESDFEGMAVRLEELSGEHDRLSALLGQHIEKLEKEPPETAEEAKERTNAIVKLNEALSRYESEIKKLYKDLDNKTRQQKDIRMQAAKAKSEYDRVKVEYDKEYTADNEKLKELRQKVADESEKLDHQDYEKYKEIKSHVTPPLALLMNNQCSGCFMTLSIGTIREMRDNNKLTLCDNCGRILYAKD